MNTPLLDRIQTRRRNLVREVERVIEDDKWSLPWMVRMPRRWPAKDLTNA